MENKYNFNQLEIEKNWEDWKLEEQFEKVKKKVLEKLDIDESYILGIFLYGSQNYGLQTETSDFDFKVIVFPKLKNIITRVVTSRTIDYGEEGQIDIKDIFKYTQVVSKHNPAYLEILETPYCKIYYEKEWKLYKQSIINNLDYKFFLKGAYGMFMGKYNSLTHRYPSKIELIEKYGYDSKQLVHQLRLVYIMEDIVRQKTQHQKIDLFRKIFNLSQKEKHYLIKIKNYELSSYQATALSGKLLEDIWALREDYFKEIEGIKVPTNEFLDNDDLMEAIIKIINKIVCENYKCGEKDEIN